MPKVSFIVPCWDQWDTILETFASIDAQTFQDFEVILMTETVEQLDRAGAISQWNGRLNKMLWCSERVGLAQARTQMLRIADGEFVVPLDADDTIEPAFLEKTLAAHEKGTAAVVVNGKATLHPGIMKDNYLNYCALYRASFLRYAGGWQQPSAKAQALEDWDLWIRMWHAGWQISSIDDHLFNWRRRHGSMSSLVEGTALFAEIKDEMLRRNNLP